MIATPEIEADLKRRLTPEFLETLAVAVEFMNWGLDANETGSFYRELCFMVDVEPRKLDLEFAK